MATIADIRQVLEQGLRGVCKQAFDVEIEEHPGQARFLLSLADDDWQHVQASNGGSFWVALCQIVNALGKEQGIHCDVRVTPCTH